MTLIETKLGTFVHYTPRILAVLLAVFFVGGNISHATPQGQEIYCASEDGRRHYCQADTRGGVTLARKHSDAACIKGQTWGYDRGAIWVDRGCRADFVTGGERGGYDRGRDSGRDRDYGRGGGGGGGRGGYSQTFYCESGDEKRHWCAEGAIGQGEVRLIRQRSGSPCIFGRTWGRDRNGVWVDRGCRADFQVSR
ncbi:MAG: DUF3011 domain-containing protein [Blastocatellia bacterium]|nr:DUF3011 domain-containing protein [Blastocatellia bacterium]